MGKMKPLAIFFCCMLTLALLCAPAARAAEPAAQTQMKVAILPFTMHTPNELSYLQQGIRDMLTSRLAWQGKVQVIDRAATDQAVRGLKGEMTPEEAVRIGRSLKADHVLFGSVTGIGQSISIDAKMASLAGSGEPLSFYAQTKSLDEVVPQINNFAQQINQKVFARPVQHSDAAASEQEMFSTRNPELLVPETMIGGDKISYLNPNFIEVTPEGSLRQPGLWRSQTFQGGILGMDIGDFDGDGHPDLVTITKDKVTVFRREAQGLKTIATYNGTKVDQFIWVTAVDVDRNRVDEIYVTNLSKRNLTRPGASEGIQESPGYVEGLSSFGLTLVGGKLQVSFEGAPYFLNGVEFPRRGKILLGQGKGKSTEGPFMPNIYEMAVRGKSLVQTVPVSLPSRCNVFNFARADVNGDNMEETILIDSANRLVLLSSAGDQLWRGDKLFAATTNSFEGKVEDRRYNYVDYYSIPSPILVTDLNKDGIPEIVVNRSIDFLGKLMPNTMKYFDKGEIISLSWDQMGMVENWKTREISGMVTAIRLADLNEDGTMELVASLVLAKDFLKLWDSKSTVFGYDLNVSPAKAASK